MTRHIDSTEAENFMSDQMDKAMEATRLETLGALLYIALSTREQFAEARYVLLEDSDQGEWLTAGDVLDKNSDRLADYLDEADSGASHLYDNMRPTWQVYAKPDSDHCYRLDIDEVIAVLPTPTVGV